MGLHYPQDSNLTSARTSAGTCLEVHCDFGWIWLKNLQPYHSLGSLAAAPNFQRIHVDDSLKGYTVTVELECFAHDVP